MQKAFEKIIEKLKRIEERYRNMYDWSGLNTVKETIEIVNQVAEEYGKKSAKEDLISKRALIEVLNKFVGQIFMCDGIDTDSVIEYQRVHKDYTAYIMQGFEYVYELLPDVPTVQIGDGWISVSERLPEESGEYLTWVRYDGREFRAIDEINCDGIVKEWNCSSDYKIIAWQPLPELYNPKFEFKCANPPSAELITEVHKKLRKIEPYKESEE